MISEENQRRVDPKCWTCGAYTAPGLVFGPNICFDCWPEYRNRKFVFVRASQEELVELFGEGLKWQ